MGIPHRIDTEKTQTTGQGQTACHLPIAGHDAMDTTEGSRHTNTGQAAAKPSAKPSAKPRAKARRNTQAKARSSAASASGAQTSQSRTGPGKTGPKKLKAIPAIDARLQIWARWRLMNEDRGEGEASGSSMLGAIMDGGGQYIRSTNPSANSMPDEVFDMDRAVTKLPIELRMVVETKYLDDHLDAPEKMSKCGCSKRHYYSRLYQAHHELLFMISTPEQLRERMK
ncbi:hypothetical protein [Oceanospirillum sediminis]|uniref:Uncharacterized protein n=1 Tax=Oceanospirillum sediminis TaxID=2760088 RepID=A0A839ILG5_9GAMM|nr:hypothetical protein [Oceanospirillum sediminis]MBB1485798.1 hypothetical protein [Oceanospirillum sediminis]